MTTRMNRRVTVLGLGITLALAALTACTQVLGLEEAKLDTDLEGAGGSDGAAGGGSGASGGGDAGSGVSAALPTHAPGSSSGGVCQTPPARGGACAQCLANCSTSIDNCLMDQTCRLDLDGYAFCLGPECDGDVEACAGKIPPGSGSPRTCAQQCVDDCDGVALASECEMHCACMLDTCDGTESFVDCVERCDLLPPEVAGCLRFHCDAAAVATTAAGVQKHCGHANSDPSPVCFPFAEVSVEERDSCGLAGQENGWPCKKASDCCSGSCEDETCVAN